MRATTVDAQEMVRQLVDSVIESLQRQALLPGATYRLQLCDAFSFPQAQAIAPYLERLGISHLYLSPIFQARPGSPHGYDICQHDCVSLELGGNLGFADFAATVREHGLALIADMVPNHMAASPYNPWWYDVLENGPSSPFAHYFDIDWHPFKAELENKVLLPLLGQSYGVALEAGEIQLVFSCGEFQIHYFEHVLPTCPRTWRDLLSYRLDELEADLGSTSVHFMEYVSILTAIDHLPDQSETSLEVVQVRQREKEIVKRRLRLLSEQSPTVLSRIHDNVMEFNGMSGDPASFDRLDAILSAQAYRLGHWKTACDDINYRRFFDVNDLAAICAESSDVFYATHQFMMKMIARGDAHGLRIDHVDGLFDPETYLWRLQWTYLAELAEHEFLGTCRPDDEAEQSPDQAEPSGSEWCQIAGDVLLQLCGRLQLPLPTADDLAAALGFPASVEFSSLPTEVTRPPHGARPPLPLYVVVEKILGPDEPLPESWPVDGTTGYDFLNRLSGVLVYPPGLVELRKYYDRILDERIRFDQVRLNCKYMILRVAMSSELQMLAERLNHISEQHRRTRDLTLNMLRHVLREVLASFPVYRTYLGPYGVSERDQRFVHQAIAIAKRRNPAIDRDLFEFLRRVLLLEHPPYLTDEQIGERELFAGRFQQVTSPVMAKGVEDTAFYVYHPLASLNEVGGEPHRPVLTLDEFHAENRHQANLCPHTLITTSTHDTKRSEDVRARMSVLSEIPAIWRKHVNSWSAMNRRWRASVEGQWAPDRNDEYLFYQTLAGAWPVGELSDTQYADFVERVQSYMEKATHEAKQHTSWISPNAAYDSATQSFVRHVLKPRSKFVQSFRTFHETVIDWGLWTALSQVAVKCAAPGTPDLYQGQEIWDFSLVDPDNRRPVDFGKREWLLGEVEAHVSAGGEALREFTHLLAVHPQDDRLKMFVTWQLLQWRRQYAAQLAAGEYVPLRASGAKAEHVIAFLWRNQQLQQPFLLLVVPRWLAILCPDGAPPMGRHVWEDTHLVLDGQLPYNAEDVFTGEPQLIGHDPVFVGDLLAEFPLAVLVPRVDRPPPRPPVEAVRSDEASQSNGG